jgi:hypothetical protein
MDTNSESRRFFSHSSSYHQKPSAPRDHGQAQSHNMSRFREAAMRRCGSTSSQFPSKQDGTFPFAAFFCIFTN